jgi:imidazolonepropionase-like amidohydrolase
MSRRIPLVCIGLLAGVGTARSAGTTYAIRDARIYTVSAPVIERGSVLIADGKIAAVGVGITAPDGATVVDGRGLSVYPGIIDANTTMGLTEVGSIQATVDAAEIGDYTPQLRAYDAIHPESEHIPVTRGNGITTVLTRPAGGILAGQPALINLDGWTVEEMAVRKTVGQVANLPSVGGGIEFDPETFSVRTRRYTEAKREYEKRIRELGEFFEQARRYLQAKEARTRDASVPPVKPDTRLEALIPVLKGETPLLVPAGRAGDIKRAAEFAEKQRVRLVILGGAEAGKIADYLKQKDVAVIYGPLLNLPEEEDDPYDLPYATPAILSRAGVRFAIASGETSDSRNLPFDGGNAVGSGLSEEEALKAITLYPAQILGVADRLGSIEPGKMANLVVTDGNLLEIRTAVKQLFINGRPVSLENKHTRLYEKYRARP